MPADKPSGAAGAALGCFIILVIVVALYFAWTSGDEAEAAPLVGSSTD